MFTVHFIGYSSFIICFQNKIFFLKQGLIHMTKKEKKLKQIHKYLCTKHTVRKGEKTIVLTLILNFKLS